MPADVEDPYAGVTLEGTYRDVAADLPNEVAIGGALITMVEPDLGHEADYNRWYEDDHFYAGAMVGPWIFSGRRWVATRDLRELRFPEDSPIASPVTKGCYISTYLILDGHFVDVTQWGVVMMRDYLRPYGRGFNHREHIFTTYSAFEFAVIRDDEPYLQPHHAMDHPFAGLVVEVLDPLEGTSRHEMLGALRDDLIPEQLSGSPLAAVLAFTPGNVGRGEVPADRYLTLLWFVQDDPRAVWERFRGHPDVAAKAGAKVVFAGPFLPTVVGTDTYVDELR
jgi:hypothetical protein